MLLLPSSWLRLLLGCTDGIRCRKDSLNSLHRLRCHTLLALLIKLRTLSKGGLHRVAEIQQFIDTIQRANKVVVKLITLIVKVTHEELGHVIVPSTYTVQRLLVRFVHLIRYIFIFSKAFVCLFLFWRRRECGIGSSLLRLSILACLDLGIFLEFDTHMHHLGNQGRNRGADRSRHARRWDLEQRRQAHNGQLAREKFVLHAGIAIRNPFAKDLGRHPALF
mmetsp:Transcript_5066/g.8303  ORF Transcript_5066/g.8303 Transcript_5066/m.8303 type:complete len:221 (+) Transcript_5066:131-793(+)